MRIIPNQHYQYYWIIILFSVCLSVVAYSQNIPFTIDEKKICPGQDCPHPELDECYFVEDIEACCEKLDDISCNEIHHTLNNRGS